MLEGMVEDATREIRERERETLIRLARAGEYRDEETGNHVIRKISTAGQVSTLAGTMGSSGHDDGTGGAASFNFPNSIATDASGNVYVSDTYNHTIRNITPAGVVSMRMHSAAMSMPLRVTIDGS